jgi:hypothetical protein
VIRSTAVIGETTEQQFEASETSEAAYPPSWVDRFTRWVDRLPGPSLAFYLGLALVLLLLESAVKWRDGAYPLGTIYPFHAVLAVSGVYFLACIHYLDRAAAAALHTFRPALTLHETEYPALHYQLTTLPAQPTRLATLAGAALPVVAVLISLQFQSVRLWETEDFGTSPVAFVLDLALVGLVVCTGACLVYHSLRQLRLINHIYTTYTDINLFQLDPLYALSGLAARTALCWAFAWYAVLAAEPGHTLDPDDVVFATVTVLLAVISFVWPLLGVHRLLERKKGQLRAAVNQRLEAVIAEMHRRVDAGELEQMDALNKALANLVIERDVLSSIPTWPWQPGTVRVLLTTLLLPIVLWLIQRLLDRLL